jgi:hypothetical protein
MTVTSHRAAVVSIATSFLLLAGVRCAQAAEIKIVSPSAYKDREGEGSVGDSCCPPFRYQQVFPAADFAALGNQPHWIVGHTTRPDQSVTSPRTAHWPDNEIRLSTTQRGPGNLSLRFDDNLGADVMQFYRGPRTVVADIDGPGPGPREFYHVDTPAGVTPYLYDPSQGNLLFDVIGWQGESPSGRSDQVPSMQTALYGSSPFATQGARNAATVFQFTFVPVPEPSSLTLFAVLLVLGSLCPRATKTKTAALMRPTT